MIRFLDHTADVLFEASAPTKSKLFEEAARALFSVICDIQEIKPSEPVKFTLSSHSLEFLLVDFLSELITQSDINDMYFSKFGVTFSQTGYSVDVVAYGEQRYPSVGRTEVKAVSYHMLKVWNDGDLWHCRVLLDI